mmetsp:Transcript_6931/g.10287  ORF Transcript_6931/g.10287 Transcript_6931/m.10287 type:complete len:264 (+) Transcript_6931:34-825(+)
MDRVYDLGAIVISLGLLLCYHSCLYFSVFFYYSDSVQLTTNMKNSIYWLRKHRQKGDAPTVTLAVQTLRNTILISIFIGGYALQTAIATINTDTSTADVYAKFRVIIIAAFSFSSFLSWASVIRIASNLGYLIGTLEFESQSSNKPSTEIVNEKKTDLEQNDAGQSEELSSTEVIVASDNTNTNSSQFLNIKRISIRKAVDMQPPDIPKESSRLFQVMFVYINLGFRFIFVTIPFAFYAAGPTALVISTFVLLVFLYIYDWKH